MEQNPSWEANSCSASQEFLTFITMLTVARPEPDKIQFTSSYPISFKICFSIILPPI
jgi:hypothetical protein